MEVENVRRMTDEEMVGEGWTTDSIHPNPCVLVMDNGDMIYPSRDPEGNGPGALFGRSADGEGFRFDP